MANGRAVGALILVLVVVGGLMFYVPRNSAQSGDVSSSCLPTGYAYAEGSSGLLSCSNIRGESKDLLQTPSGLSLSLNSTEAEIDPPNTRTPIDLSNMTEIQIYVTASSTVSATLSVEVDYSPISSTPTWTQLVKCNIAVTSTPSFTLCPAVALPSGLQTVILRADANATVSLTLTLNKVGVFVNSHDPQSATQLIQQTCTLIGSGKNKKLKC